MAGIFPRRVRREHDGEQNGCWPITCAPQTVNIGIHRCVMVDIGAGHREAAPVAHFNEGPDGKCMLRQWLQKVVNVSVQLPCKYFGKSVHAGMVVQGNAAASSKNNDGNGNGLVVQHVQKSDPRMRSCCKCESRWRTKTWQDA